MPGRPAQLQSLRASFARWGLQRYPNSRLRRRPHQALEPSSVVHRLPAWPMPLRKRCLAGRTLRFVGVAVVCVCVRGPVRRLPAADGGKGQSRLARARRGHDTGNSGKCAPRSRLGVTTLLAGVTDVSCVVAVHCTGWRGGSPQSVSIGGPLGHQRMLPQRRRGSRCTSQGC